MIDKTLVDRLREEAKIAREERGLPVYTPEKIEKLADAIEREYLPRPRFEDGGLVCEGDTVCIDGMLPLKVHWYSVRSDGLTVFSIPTSSRKIKTGERVKRPEPEVLDSDGVQIRVGDTVWEVGRRRPLKVTAVEPGIVSYETEDGAHGMYYAIGDLTHKQPDSLERIEEDAKESVCVYFDKQGSTKCSGCDKSLHSYLECHREMMLDLLNRQREVLERDHER